MRDLLPLIGPEQSDALRSRLTAAEQARPDLRPARHHGRSGAHRAAGAAPDEAELSDAVGAVLIQAAEPLRHRVADATQLADAAASQLRGAAVPQRLTVGLGAALGRCRRSRPVCDGSADSGLTSRNWARR